MSEELIGQRLNATELLEVAGARTMCTLDLESIERARAMIEDIVASRYLGVQADPAFGFSDFDQLPPKCRKRRTRGE